MAERMEVAMIVTVLIVVCALAVAASRIILRAHYAADVIGGALVAWLTVAWLARVFADRRSVFDRAGDGRTRVQSPPVS